MKKLAKAQVLRMYNDMVNQFGGTRGMRDEGLLDSALSAPFQTYDGFKLYPEIEEKAAGLVAVRARGGQDLGQMSLDSLIERWRREVEAKAGTV